MDGQFDGMPHVSVSARHRALDKGYNHTFRISDWSRGPMGTLRGHRWRAYLGDGNGSHLLYSSITALLEIR